MLQPARAALCGVLLCALVLLGAAYPLPPSTSQCRTVTGDGVNIRAGPGVGYAAETEKLWKCYRIHYKGTKVTDATGKTWAAIWWLSGGSLVTRYVDTTYLAYCPAAVCASTDAATCSKCNNAKTYLINAGVPSATAGEGACLAWYESKYTNLVHVNSDGSTDFGWWQINNRFWCSPGPSPATNTCNVSCSTLLNDPAKNAKCAAKVRASAGSWGLWATAPKFYCRQGCPCGV